MTDESYVANMMRGDNARKWKQLTESGKVNIRYSLARGAMRAEMLAAIARIEDGTEKDAARTCEGELQRLVARCREHAEVLWNSQHDANEAVVAALRAAKGDALTGKSFLVTGEVEGMSREEIKRLIIANGGTIGGSVSSKLSFLVVGDSPGVSKIQKAEEIGITMMPAAEFIDAVKSVD